MMNVLKDKPSASSESAVFDPEEIVDCQLEGKNCDNTDSADGGVNDSNKTEKVDADTFIKGHNQGRVTIR